MKIKACKNLDDRTLKQILEIVKVCKNHDKLSGNIFLDTTDNFNQNINSYFLLYKGNILISFLTMLIPTQQEAEISAFTLPAYRRNGYFAHLLAKAVIELNKYKVLDMLFVCERQSYSGKKVIASLNAQLSFTEYIMKLKRSDYVSFQVFRLALKRADLRDLAKIAETSMNIFAEPYHEAKSRVEDCFDSVLREQYIAVADNKIIGLCSINLEEDEVSIYALGIVPDYRGQGYGKELLCLMVDNLIRRGVSHIRLMVNCDNIQAITIYRKYGFRIAATIEYHKKKVEDCNSGNYGRCNSGLKDI